jgi:hypothetical protein
MSTNQKIAPNPFDTPVRQRERFAGGSGGLHEPAAVSIAKPAGNGLGNEREP